MTNLLRVASLFSVVVMLASCEEHGLICRVTDRESAEQAVVGVCPTIDIADSDLVDLQALGELDRPAEIWIYDNNNLETTDGLGLVTGQVFVSGDNPALSEVIIESTDNLTIRDQVVEQITWSLVRAERDAVLNLLGTDTPVVKLMSSEPVAPSLILTAPRPDLTVQRAETVVPARLSWSVTTPSSLTVLQAFGPLGSTESRPPVNGSPTALFHGMKPESAEVLSAYAAWLELESPGANVDAFDDSGAEIPLE
jgi:hypothetical protein